MRTTLSSDLLAEVPRYRASSIDMLDFVCIYPVCLNDRQCNTRMDLGTDLLSSPDPVLTRNPELYQNLVTQSDYMPNSILRMTRTSISMPEAGSIARPIPKIPSPCIPIKRTFHEMLFGTGETPKDSEQISASSLSPRPIVSVSTVSGTTVVPLPDSTVEVGIRCHKENMPRRSPLLTPISEEGPENSDSDLGDQSRTELSTSFTELRTSTLRLGSSPPSLMSSTPPAPVVGHASSDLPSITPNTQSLPLNSLSPDSNDDNGNISPAGSISDDSDSVFDEGQSDNTSSYTASLLSDVKNYAYENGRRYHSYREGHYVLPNDEPEQDRQDLLHHVRNLVLNGRLYRAPLDSNIQRALDIGTGTGIWAIDFADSFPSAEVIGTDLSPIQPSWVPPNLRFVVDDAESPWLYSPNRPFDFIHARDLGGAIADWPRLMRQSYKNLRPGGWIELQEFEVMLKSDDDSMRLAPALCQFLELLTQASEGFHRPMNIAEGHRQRLLEAGFENVRDEVYKVPSSVWARDPLQREIGRYNQCSLLMAVESYSLALFTRVLGWSNNDTQVFLAGVRKDLKNPAVHTYCNLHVVYGRKPSQY